MTGKDKKANELNGKTWTRYSISVWSDIQKTAEEKSLKHPALFPRHLTRRLIRIFSRRGDLVLDPFMGSGSTLLEAGSMERCAVGLDLSREYLDLYRERMEGSAGDNVLLSAFQDDARNLLQYVTPGSVDLCLTSPPYWNILKERRSADKKQLRHYGDHESDLGSIDDYNQFLEALTGVFREVHEALKPGKYCLVVVMDIRKKNRFFPLHMDLTQRMQLLGFTLDDMIIWDRRREYNLLRPLGFPYVFRINKVHEYIMIFQKQR